jgi:hypothetical protein
MSIASALRSAPRTEPSGPHSGTRLPPRDRRLRRRIRSQPMHLDEPAARANSNEQRPARHAGADALCDSAGRWKRGPLRPDVGTMIWASRAARGAGGRMTPMGQFINEMRDLTEPKHEGLRDGANWGVGLLEGRGRRSHLRHPPMSAIQPLSGAIRTLSRHRRMTEFDPERSEGRLRSRNAAVRYRGVLSFGRKHGSQWQ